MGKFTVYDSDEVRRLLDYEGCIAAVRAAMARFTAKGTEQPLRSIFEIDPGRLLGLMPGSLAAPEGFGAKVISVFPEMARPGRSAHRGVVVLFDRQSGEVACIADAGEVTAIRTGAASAVATDLLAKSNSTTLAIFGCGAQAASHVRALTRVRKLEQILVWSRSVERARQFAARMEEELRVPVHALTDGREAAASADIICTTTGSATPVLLGEWVRPGTHVNAVGSSHVGPVEIDSQLVVASRYIVDSRRSALAAAAEFLRAKEAGLVDDNHIAAEIGEVLLGKVRGRTSADEITIYKSLGHIVQDLAAVRYLHERAGRDGAAR